MLKLVSLVHFGSTFVRLVRDPNRVDLVFALADKIAPDPATMRPMLERPIVAAYLARRLPPLRVSLPALRALPEGTLGRTFAAFLDKNGFDPTGLYHSGDADGDDLHRFKVRMERTHDLWHTTLGFDTDVAGELGLQAFTLAQVGASLALVILAAGMLNSVFLAPADATRRMEAIARGWQLGRRVRPMFDADWETMLAWPIEQVREHFGVTSPDVHAAALAA